MSMHVCSGATLTCSFGSTPSSLTVLPANRVATSQMPAATVMDHVPTANIMPFGMCTLIANPAVASATAAAQGVLTPVPCVPVTPTPWAPGSPTVMLGGAPALNAESKLTCIWGGVISITVPGQGGVQIP